MYENWLAERGEDFRAGVRIGGWIPSKDIKTPSLGLLQDATSVLDAYFECSSSQEA